MSSQFINIGRPIGQGQPTYVIAEAGVNHNGQLDMAFQLVDVAVEAGADAVKFQTFHAEELVAENTPKAEYQLKGTNPLESQLDMLRKLELSYSDHLTLVQYCIEKEIEFLSTPFDEQSVDVLVGIGLKALKVPSGEITNPLLLRKIGATGLPVILSTGMSTLEEVRLAVKELEAAGCKELAILHCVSCYPASPEDLNLRAMETMREAFDVPVGLSDHSLGTEMAIAAVALGASIIEKHVTIDKRLPGPDHAASLEPLEFASMVRAIRFVESALGSGEKVPATSEENTRYVARRSLVAAQSLHPGTVIKPADLKAKRPASGISAMDFDLVVGRTVRRRVEEEEVLKWDDLT